MPFAMGVIMLLYLVVRHIKFRLKRGAVFHWVGGGGAFAPRHKVSPLKWAKGTSGAPLRLQDT